MEPHSGRSGRRLHSLRVFCAFALNGSEDLDAFALGLDSGSRNPKVRPSSQITISEFTYYNK